MEILTFEIGIDLDKLYYSEYKSIQEMIEELNKLRNEENE